MKLIEASGLGGRLRRFATGLLCAFTVAAPVRGGVNLAEVPLHLTVSVEPNIMFILDDSGSMQWEVMPDGLRSISTHYLFPRPPGLYGDTVYDSRIVVFLDTDPLNVRVRSAYNNRIFYDPQRTYLPWSTADNGIFPPADPTNALHNPALPGLGGIDLTREQDFGSWRRHDGSDAEMRSFHPMTFYVYKGAGDATSTASYVKYQIRGGSGYRQDLDGGAEVALAGFDWPGGITRSVLQERQNFANWYTYYRSRALTARAGIGKAFAAQGGGMRVGFGAINKGPGSVDGEDTGAIIGGVRGFAGAGRAAFFDLLYGHPIAASGTPLRRALESAGRYYARSSNAGPWGNTPGDNADDSAHVACRQSFSILMTDGFWNGGDPDVGNADGTSGPRIPGNSPYEYSPTDPYRDPADDQRSNTLADVAMAFWKNDLRPDLENQVWTSDRDPAFWQHMVTFGIGLGVEGGISPDGARAAVGEGAAIAWPDPYGSDPAKLDDLLHAAINGRGGFFTASDPDALAAEMTQTLAAITDRQQGSAASVAANATRLDAGALVYQARFDSEDWSGQLLAFPVDTTTGRLATDPIWDAGRRLPAPGDRRIFTIQEETGKGMAFRWADLQGQRGHLDRDALGNIDGHGEARLAWLRGDRGNEAPNGPGFRVRPGSVLGDIVNSDPVFVGTRDYGFSALPGDEGRQYAAFRRSGDYLGRSRMLYVGANDGMLHGFDAETGIERLAYVPRSLFPHLGRLTSPDYVHRFFVNGSPRTSDAYLRGAWRSVLVGTTGAGARSVFALDVTDPDGFDSADVMWEFTADDSPELGYTVGEATIARLEAGGRWVALVGNGYNSASHTARLFILDLETGALLRELDTGVGDAAMPNGLHAPVPVDLDGDRITDFAYAGDLHGNLWRFDLGGAAEADWRIADMDGDENPGPAVFVARDQNGVPRPITVRPTVGPHPRGGVMVYFGTGKFLEVGDEIIAADPPIQAFYGVWDKGVEIAPDQLVAQTIDWQGGVSLTGPDDSTVQHDLRVVSDNDVDYLTASGWYLDLVDPEGGAARGERVVSRALLRSGRIIFTSMIPSSDPCGSGGDGWLMEMDAVSGGRVPTAVFDLNGDGVFDRSDWVEVDLVDAGGGTKKVLVPPSGIGSTEGIINTPGVIGDGGREYKFASGSSGDIQRVVESSGDPAGRKGWWQLR